MHMHSIPSRALNYYSKHEGVIYKKREGPASRSDTVLNLRLVTKL